MNCGTSWTDDERRPNVEPKFEQCEAEQTKMRTTVVVNALRQWTTAKKKDER